MKRLLVLLLSLLLPWLAGAPVSWAEAADIESIAECVRKNFPESTSVR